MKYTAIFVLQSLGLTPFGFEVDFGLKPVNILAMCAQYLIKAKLDQLAKFYGIKIPKGMEYFEERVLPYRFAPVILNAGKSTTVKMMNFSLIPSWSKDPKVKFSTHNARLESFDEKKKKDVMIYEKPTWRGPFKSKRCLVPMNRFVEPIYFNKFAGNMVQFFPKDDHLLTAAAIHDEWVDKKTGEIIHSFAIVTDDPIKFVQKIGHDRSPIFLKEKAFSDWLDPKNDDPEELVKLLRSNKESLELDAEVDRPMSKGWEKRIPK